MLPLSNMNRNGLLIQTVTNHSPICTSSWNRVSRLWDLGKTSWKHIVVAELLVNHDVTTSSDISIHENHLAVWCSHSLHSLHSCLNVWLSLCFVSQHRGSSYVMSFLWGNVWCVLSFLLSSIIYSFVEYACDSQDTRWFKTVTSLSRRVNFYITVVNHHIDTWV